MRYTTKPVTIEAEVYQGRGQALSPEFQDAIRYDPLGGPFIPTLEGMMHVSVGDYIIKGLKGEFYPCKPDIFRIEYEPADQAGS